MGQSPDPVLFSSDDAFAAALVTTEGDAPRRVLLIFQIDLEQNELGPGVRDVQDVQEFIWLPDSHILVYRGADHTAAIDLDIPDLTVPMLELNGLRETQHVCMALVPGVDAVLLLVAEQEDAQLMLHDMVSNHITSWSRALPSGARGRLGKPLLTVGCRSVAVWRRAGLGQAGGMCMWAFDGTELGELLWVGSGFLSLELSACGLFVAASRGSDGHVVLDALTGACLLELPVCHVPELTGLVLALRSTWAGSGQLHAFSVHMPHSKYDDESEGSGSEAGISSSESDGPVSAQSVAFQVLTFNAV